MSIRVKFITGLTLPLLLSSGVASAADFIITGSDNSTNGVGTIDGAPEATIADNAINGSDTVSLGVALSTTGVSVEGIETSGSTNNIAVSSSGSITTAGDNAYGIYQSDNYNTTTMSGSITTSGDNATGIYHFGDNNTTTMSGSIATTGDNAQGIYNLGNSNTTTMSGSISTTGVGSEGFEIRGENNTINISGSIVSEDYGIYNYGDDNKITMSGSVVSGKSGINSRGYNNTIIVSGSITTEANLRDGIENDGPNSTTIMSGSIVAAGDGIENDGDHVTINMSGSIVAGQHGIRVDGDYSTVIVSGSITSKGHGIYLDEHFSTNIISGSITTTGDGKDGVYNEGDFSTNIISGSITTTGEESHGIEVEESSMINMSGSITTSGDNAYGINITDDYSTNIISGSIATTGDNSHGINYGDNDSTTTISGIVSAIGTGSSALHNHSGSGNSITLGEGATIIGDITALAAATYNKLTLNLGQGTSYAYSVGGGGVGTGAGQWTFSDPDGRTPVVTTSGTNCAASGVTVCNLLIAIGSGNAMEHDELQFSINSSMIGSLKFGNGQADAPAESMASKSNTWVNVYGGTSKRASSTTYSSFDTRNAGLTIGTPVSISDTLSVDLVFNTSSTNLDIGLTKDQEITAKSYNIGAVVYDLAPSTGWAVDAFGFIGRNSYDGKRKVMSNDTTTGSETVTASYSGMEVLVGIDAQYSTPINETLSFIGGINASLSNERMDAYSESKYFAWDARTMTQATGGITAGLEYHTDALTTFASLGAQRSSLQNGKAAGYTNNGTAGSYTDSANGDTYRTASIGFDYAVEGGMSITGAMEQLSSSGGVSGNSASLSVNRKF
jgi:hypothetical protein